jgi:hypothetical protein
LPGLTKALGGPDLWVKRDDCTGLAGGGNKTRKLEFLLGEALDQDADTLVTQGAVQSNHVRQTVAAAARYGMACEVILEERTGSKATDYTRSGNVLLDRLMGAKLRNVPGGTDMNAELAKVAAEVTARGGKPYVIPGGGSNAIGALGYVDCAIELVRQADDMGLVIDRIVTATGSAGTHAGLVAPTFPLMNGALVPAGLIDATLGPVWSFLEAPLAIQFIHRLLAYVTTCLVLGAAWRARGADVPPWCKVAATAMVVHVLMQVTLGALTVLWFVPISVASLHQLNATLLLGQVVLFVFSARRG